MFKWLSEAKKEEDQEIVPRQFGDTDSGCCREPSPAPRAIRDIFTEYLDKDLNEETEKNISRWRNK